MHYRKHCQQDWSITTRNIKILHPIKIHKTVNAGHPVVGSVNCHTNTISKNVDYVRYTTDFLKKLDKVKNIPNDCLLVNLDVKSLYTNKANNEGI